MATIEAPTQVNIELIADELIGAAPKTSDRFREYLIGYLKEAYGIARSHLIPDVECFVNAQAGTYSYLGESHINNICGSIQLAPGRAGKREGRRRTITTVPDCSNIKLRWCKLFLDSCAFTDVLTDDRVAPRLALDRQLYVIEEIEKLNKDKFLEILIVSYDRLIDEKHIAGTRIKERWSIEEGEFAVSQTVEAAKYLDSQRDRLDGHKLVMSCQGVDADQYQRCTEQVLEYCQPDDVLGLGGWCILGKQKRWLPVFWEVCDRVIPIIAASGIQQVHIFGCTWYKPMQGFPVSPLTRLLEACDEHGLRLSVDGRSPIGNALWKDWKQAGATSPYWRHNLAWVKAELATLRDSAGYQHTQPHSLPIIGEEWRSHVEEELNRIQAQLDNCSVGRDEVTDPELKKVLWQGYKENQKAFADTVRRYSQEAATNGLVFSFQSNPHDDRYNHIQVYIEPTNPSSSTESGLEISFGYTKDEILAGVKTCTRRDWKDSHAKKFIKAYEQGLKIRAIDKDRRAGGKQIGWLTLTQHPYKEAIGAMTEADLKAEGGMCSTVDEFAHRYFKGDLEKRVWVIWFEFEPIPELVTSSYRGFTVGDRIVEDGNNPEWGDKHQLQSLIKRGQILSFKAIPGCSDSDLHPFIQYEDGSEGFGAWGCLKVDDHAPEPSPEPSTNWTEESAQALTEVVRALSGQDSGTNQCQENKEAQEQLTQPSEQVANAENPDGSGLECLQCSMNLQVSGAQQSQETGSASKQPSLSKSTQTHKESLGTTIQIPQSTTTSEPTTQDPENTISIGIHSPARAHQALVLELDSITPNPVFGLKPCDASSRGVQTLWLLRTLKVLSTEDYGKFLGDCEWQAIRGTIRSSYRQLGSELLTRETDSSLLPTPTSYAEGSDTHRPAGTNKLERTLRLLPTVTASQATAPDTSKGGGNRLERSLLPTPVARDGKGPTGTPNESLNDPIQEYLTGTDKMNSKVPGWMMGFQPGYAEEILMDGGATIPLPDTQEFPLEPQDDEPASSSTAELSCPNKPRSHSVESSTSTQSLETNMQATYTWKQGDYVASKTLEGVMGAITKIDGAMVYLDTGRILHINDIEAQKSESVEARMSANNAAAKISHHLEVGDRIEALTQIPFGTIPTFTERLKTEVGEQGTVTKVMDAGKLCITWDVGETVYIEPTQLKRLDPINWKESDRIWHGTPDNQGEVLEDLGEGVYKIKLDGKPEPFLVDRETIHPIYSQTVVPSSIDRYLERNSEPALDSYPKEEWLNPGLIVLDCGTQSRPFEFDQERLDDYAEAMKTGDWEMERRPLPEVCLADDGLYYAVDCHHRAQAGAIALPPGQQMLFLVRRGSLAQARIWSAAANTMHGLAADNSPKGVRKRVEMFLENIEELDADAYQQEFLRVPDLTDSEKRHGRFSSRTIARYLRLRTGQDRTVSNIIKEREMAAKISHFEVSDRIEVISPDGEKLPDWLSVGDLGTIKSKDRKTGLWVKWDKRSSDAPFPINPDFAQKTDKPFVPVVAPPTPKPITNKTGTPTPMAVTAQDPDKAGSVTFAAAGAKERVLRDKERNEDATALENPTPSHPTNIKVLQQRDKVRVIKPGVYQGRIGAISSFPATGLAIVSLEATNDAQAARENFRESELELIETQANTGYTSKTNPDVDLKSATRTVVENLHRLSSEELEALESAIAAFKSNWRAAS